MDTEILGPVDVERYPAVNTNERLRQVLQQISESARPRSQSVYTSAVAASLVDLLNEKRPCLEQDIATSPSFTYWHPGILLLKLVFMINGANIEYLLAKY